MRKAPAQTETNDKDPVVNEQKEEPLALTEEIEPESK